MCDKGAARRREVYLCVQRGRRERTLSARVVASEVEEEVEENLSRGRGKRGRCRRENNRGYRRMKEGWGAMVL